MENVVTDSYFEIFVCMSTVDSYAKYPWLIFMPVLKEFMKARMKQYKMIRLNLPPNFIYKKKQSKIRNKN